MSYSLFCRFVARALARRDCRARRCSGVQQSLCDEGPKISDRGASQSNVVLSESRELTDVRHTGQQLEQISVARSPASPVPLNSYNLVPFVGKSEVLTRLISIGVSLSDVEKIPGAAEALLKLDFDRDVKARILFLHDLGLSNVAKIINKNPLILLEDVDDLKVRVNYLKYRRFDDAAVVTIINRCPEWLSESVPHIDAAIGKLQKEFYLTGNEVREVLAKHPKLVLFDWMFVKAAKLELKEFLGFSQAQEKAILLAQPKVFTTAHYHLRRRFDYLHNVMGISHELITSWPSILRAREHVIKERHLFLSALGRAQYDATQPNYVSLKALVTLPHEEFCRQIAKSDMTVYNNFLKTI